MNKYQYGISMTDFDAVRLSVASDDDVMEWSHGEVTKPETINYRTQKPERDGLFCEKIFGPVKDINPHDAKFKGVRYREAAVDKKGDLVTKSIVRRERMGHIKLAAPVAHIWFMRGTPSAIGLLLGVTVKNLERVVYFASYMIMHVEVEKKDQMIADIEAEAAAAKMAIKKRYEEEAKAEGANVKALAAAHTKEVEDAMEGYLNKKAQLQELVKYGLISDTDYRALDPDMKAICKVGMGGDILLDLLKEIDLDTLIEDLKTEADSTKGQRKKKILKRLKVIEGMKRTGIKPESMILNAIPVIPPDLRPMVQLTGGRFATSDLNDLYRRVINRNNRLKKLIDLKAPAVIKRNEQRMLQEAVDALIDNNSSRSGRAVSNTGGRRKLKSLSDMLKGKQGRFRQNLLGKRVDYSGRSVIVSGPELNIHECGLPKMMALELFKPFVMGRLIEKDKAHNIKSATRMIEQGESAVWDALDEVIEGKYVLLNRAPTLHRLGIQAFQPRLIEGKAIQLHPLVCKGFNADFDGDQMAVHLPLSVDAQREAKELMAAGKNLLKPADGTPILHIEQDIVLGSYYLTYDKSDHKDDKITHYVDVNDALYAYEAGQIALQSPITVSFRGERRETTLGRALFNEILPEDFTYVDEAMTKKKLNSVMAQVYDKFGQDAAAVVADKLKVLGFKYATVSGLSMGMSDFTEVDGIDGFLKSAEEKAAKVSEQFEQGLITEDERYRLTVKTWMDADEKVRVQLEKQFAGEDNSMSTMVVSGARGSIGQVKQVTGSVGVLADATGKAIELPIRSNYKDGLSPLEYFSATRGARKGLIDTALKTADSGYLTRRLVDVSQDVFTIEGEDEDNGFAINRKETEETGLDFAERITGRYVAVAIKGHLKKGELITAEAAEAIAADSGIEQIMIMSVLSCENLTGVSQKSYGTDMASGELIAPNQPIGVIAAQSIGEPGTQLTLRTFHAGGVASDDITTGLPRVDELFEARQPKGQAFMSEIAGVVTVWEEGESYVVQVVPDSAKTDVYKLEGRKAQVKSGTEVAVGDVIADSEDGKKPLKSKVAGLAEVFDKEIVVASGSAKVVRYTIPGFKQLSVTDGDHVEAGGRLTNGSLNLQDLLEHKGTEATQRYIMNEILSIFAAQGQTIADKHLEIVIRQMFSKVLIEEPGDGPYVLGDIITKSLVVEQNKKLAKAKKELIGHKQMLLGITKVSTWSDSFLSAASFQDTTRVLISAAINGKVDHLYGLKENVIIGRKIPVGTGVASPDDFADDQPTEVDEA